MSQKCLSGGHVRQSSHVCDLKSDPKHMEKSEKAKAMRAY